MRYSFGLPVLVGVPALACAGAAAQQVVLPAGTPMWVKTNQSVRMRVGQTILGQLVYPVYADNAEILPIGTKVQGTITGMDPDRPHRLQSRLRGDFTPFSQPVGQFQQGRLPDGTTFVVPAGPATDGATVKHLEPPPPSKGGFLRREWDMGVGMAKDRVQNVTGPGKKDRLVSLLYSQLPYHPQSVTAGTVWTVETTAPLPLTLPEKVAAAPQAAKDSPAGPKLQTVAAVQKGSPTTWTLQAYLAEPLSSADAKVGQSIRAIVAEPVVDPATGEVEVPQGTVLRGEVTKAKAARRFGRAGDVRFDFRKLELPGTPEQQVQTTLSGLDAAGDANLALDREGKVERKPQDKLVVPLLLLVLARGPLDGDGGGSSFGKNAGASNSLGVVGFVVGTAGGWTNVAAGLGFYGSAIAIWNRWVKRGADTTLPKDTRLVIQTTARRSAPMRSAGAGH